MAPKVHNLEAARLLKSINDNGITLPTGQNNIKKEAPINLMPLEMNLITRLIPQTCGLRQMNHYQN